MFLAIGPGGQPDSVWGDHKGAMRALGWLGSRYWLLKSEWVHGVLCDRVTDGDGYLRGWIFEIQYQPDKSVGTRGAW